MGKIDSSNLISGNHSIVRNVNRAAILNLIREHQPISRVELSKLTNLNKSTVSSIVSELIEEKLVHETSDGESTGGRRPILLQLNTSEIKIGAIDFDPDITYIAIGDIQANIFAKKLIPFQKGNPCEFIEHCLLELLLLKAELNLPNLNSIGISIPGIVDTQKNAVIIAPDLQWQDINFDEITQQLDIYGLPEQIILENEANASVLAEQWFGKEIKNRSNIVFITEGIGTGVILDKKLVPGSYHAAGQFGHMTIVTDGKPCICGNRGCWEVYSSKAATVERYYFLKGQKFSGNINEEVVKIIQLAAQGDWEATRALEDTGRYLGIGISNIIKAIDPEVIVLGGVITQAWKIIYPKIIEEIKNRVFFNIKKDVQIIPSTLGERSSLIGALTLVIKEIFRGYKITK